ncbi:hypothetical protein GCU60_18135 [Blastococcus saxobsidens]|uniref:Uncharacterized protein n=1 Tax=Blastococcus saxobsidens TaxID=138336 RepID=A0A6L9W846_9ACTN|nr:hypothetical protein [Blastococcus saxobsidens]NEK87661.1 hypothetical protein [Blastococcus saxobsidens]
MVIVLVELLLLGVVVLLCWFVATSLLPALRSGTPHALRRSGRDRAVLAAAVAQARWVPGHDEVDGRTRILVRRTYIGPDGLPVVLDERVLEDFSAQDPAWEARFTEGMARARFRCTYLNTEESG